MSIECVEIYLKKEEFLKTVEGLIILAKGDNKVIKFNAISTDFYITKFDTLERFALLYDLFYEYRIKGKKVGQKGE